MDASPLPASSNEGWAEQFDETLRTQRQRVREFLAAQQQRLRTAEDALGRQLDHLAGLLAEDRNETAHTRQDLQVRSAQLARETETLEAIRRDLDLRRGEWDQLRQQSEKQHRALAEQISRGEELLERRSAEMDRRREELDRDRAELERRGEEIEARRTEIERRRPELESGEAQLQLDRQELDRKCRQLESQREELDTLRQELDARRVELQRRLEDVAQRQSDTENTRRRLARELRDRHAAGLREVERLRDGVVPLKSERDALLARVVEAEQRLAQQQAQPAEPGPAAGESDDEYRRRYELAVEDLRELRAENAELREQLAEGPSARPAGKAPAGMGGRLSWEAEKLKILAALENDFDDDDERDRREQLKIEEVVRRTDTILAEKDREITELKQLLEQQAGSVGELAVGAAALAEVLDADSIVQEERENLTRLQQEWREKLRQAEIDISVERAKLARERLHLDEKLRTLNSQTAADTQSTGAEPSTTKTPSGRWLQRLGLGNREDDAE